MNRLLRNLFGAAAGAVALKDTFVYGLSALVLSAAALLPSAAQAARETAPFDVPEGWADAAAVPKDAEVLTGKTGNVRLETIPAVRQQLNGRAANVAVIKPGSPAPNVYGVEDDGHGSAQKLERDVWLKVTGGAFGTVVGGAGMDWNSDHTTFVRGALFTEIAADATAGEVFGALHKGGGGGNGNANQPAFKGRTLVVVNGLVNGNIVGGAHTVHNWEPHIEGDTSVLVKSLQPNGNARVLGGSLFGGNSASAVRHIGNTSVTIDLPQDLSGTFGREIVGGSYAEKDVQWGIDGNTSVTVNAPRTVTFAKHIFGGTITNGTGAGKADVTGNSTVTLNGGTYSGIVTPAGYGVGCAVLGEGRVVLNGAVFRTGSRLILSDGGSRVASSYLEIGGGTDVSGLDEAAVFDSLALTGDVTLGTNRMLSDYRPSALTAPVCLTVTLTPEEAAARDVPLLAGYDGELPDTLTVSVTNAAAGDVWTVMRAPDGTVRAGAPRTVTWSGTAAEATWSQGFAGFGPGDTAVFGPGDPVRVRVESLLRCAEVRIDRPVTLVIGAGEAGLQANTVTVGPNGVLKFEGTQPGTKVRARYVRMQLLRRSATGTNADGFALSELALMNGDAMVPRSSVARVYGTYPGDTGLAPLNDGLLDTGHKWYWPRTPLAPTDCYIVYDAGPGRTFVCDGYKIGISDQAARTPADWRMEVGNDGYLWKEADSRRHADETVKGWRTNSWLDPAFRFTAGFANPVSVGTLRLEGTLVSAGLIEGRLVCADGARLQLTDGEPLRLNGSASGTLQLTLAPGDAVSEPRRVLIAAEQPSLTVLPPVGAVRNVVWYEQGAYWVKADIDPPFRASVAGTRRLSELNWTDKRGRAVSYEAWSALGKSQRMAELSLADGVSVLTLDAAVPELLSLTVTGQATSSLTLAGDHAFAADRLEVLRATLTADASRLTVKQASVQGTLEFSVAAGESQTLPMALDGDGTFRKIGDGTLTLLLPENGAGEGCLIDGVTAELAGGLLRLGGSAAVPMPQLSRAVFRFTDDDGDGHADGRLEAAGWLTSSSLTDFFVAEGVTDAAASLKLSGTGAVRKSGKGTLTLTLAGAEGETAVYSGETVLDAGVLRVNAASALTLAGAVSGVGSLEFAGAPVTLSAYNSYKGVTRLTAGASVTLTGDASLGKGAVILADTARLTVNSASDIRLSDIAAAGAGAVLAKRGDGSLTAASVRGGTLVMGGGLMDIGPLSAETPVLTELSDGILVFSVAGGKDAVRTMRTTLDKAPGAQHFRVIRTADGVPEMPRRVELKDGLLSFLFAEDGNVWNNRLGTGKWSTPGNWTTGAVPVPGEEVAVMAGVGELDIDAADVTVRTLNVLGGYRDELVMKGRPLTVTDSLLVNASLRTDAATLRLREHDGASPAFSGRVFVADGVTLTVNVASGDWPVGDISGKGRLLKTGAGSLTVVGSRAVAGGVLRGGVTVETAEGVLRFVSADGSEPTLGDTALVFGGRAAGVRASKWVTVSGILTVDTVADTELVADGADPVSLHGDGSLVKRGAGTFAWTVLPCDCHSGLKVLAEEGAIGLVGDNADFGGVVSGSGRIQITRGTLTLSGANVHSGGVEVREGAVLKSTAAGDGFGPGPLTGTGTVVLPRNTMPADALTRLLRSADWRGTLLIDYDQSNRITDIDLTRCGNRGSAVAIAGTLQGFLSKARNTIGRLELRGTLSIDNGYSNYSLTVDGGLTGTGKLQTTGNQYTDILVPGGAADYRGGFDIRGSHCVIVGSSADHRSPGWIIVDNGRSAYVAEDKEWTATWVYPGAVICGNGRVLDQLVFEDGAVIDVPDGSWLHHARRWNSGLCTVKGGLAVRFPEGTVLPALNETGRRILESEVPIAMPKQFSPTVTVGGTPVAAAVKLSADGRALDVYAVNRYEAVAEGARIDWESLDWRLNGTGPAMKFSAIADREQAAFSLTAENDVLVQVSESVVCHSLMTAGDGRVTLNFSESMVTRDSYASISPLKPFELTLIRAINETAAFDVTIDALRYGATAFISRDGNGATAVISRDTGKPTADALSVNFTQRDHLLPDEPDADHPAEGFMPLAGRHWKQVTSPSGSDVMRYYSVKTNDSTDSDVRITWEASGWKFPRAKQVLNRAYLDEFASQVNIEVTNVPAEWAAKGYNIVVYASTDDLPNPFTAKRFMFGEDFSRRVGYTFDRDAGVTVECSADWPNDEDVPTWGSSAYNTDHNDFAEGQNVLVIRDVKETAFRMESPFTWIGPRGCISAIQLLYSGDAGGGLPADYAATAAGEVRWTDLDWTLDGAPADTLPEDAEVYLNLTGDTVLDLQGATPVASVTVNGQGYRLTLRNAGTFAPRWNFSSGLTLCMADPATDAVPSQVIAWPGRLLYTYAYANPDGYIALSDTVTEFAAGFDGDLHAPAATHTVFSGGSVRVRLFASDRGTVEMNGTTTVEKLLTDREGDTIEGLGIGNGVVILGGRSRVTVPRLILSDGGASRSAELHLEDDARLEVTGSTNTDYNTASFLFGHWHGPSLLKVSDRAVLSAEQAVMLVGYTGHNQTLRMEGGEIRVKGVAVSKNAAGTNTFNLYGGRLLVGSEGLKTNGTRQVRLTMGRNASLGAFENCTLDGRRAVESLSLPDGVMTLGGGDGEILLTDNFFLADAFSGVVIRRGGAPVTVRDVTGRVRSLTVEEGAKFRMVGSSLGSSLVTDLLELGGNLFMDAGAVLNATAFRPVGMTALLSVACGSTMADCGYLSASDGVPADLSNLFVEMVLNPDRVAESFPPMVPVIVGPTFGGTPSLRSVSVRNDSSAMNPPEPIFDPSGLLGDGLYLKLSGDGVAKAYNVTLSNRGDHRVRQSTAETYTYQSFSASQPGSRMVIPEGGILLEQAAFRSGARGSSITVRAEGTAPYTLLQGQAFTISLPMEFDLTAWDLSSFVRGAVRGLPVSTCLVAGSISRSAGEAQVTARLTRNQLPDGFAARIEVTKRGLYLVVEADRTARSVSLNLSESGEKLNASEARFGLWPVPRLDWNELCDVWISDRLTMAGRGGTPVTAVSADGLPTQMDFQGGVSVLNRAVPAGGLTRVFSSDSAARTFSLRSLPFDTFRLILTFSTDFEGAAAYAPIVVNGHRYTMDREFCRRDILGNGASIPADRSWGFTRSSETGTDLGLNTLVTDVIAGTDTVTVELPAMLYGETYAGVAAIQAVEAPEVTAPPRPRAYTLMLEESDAGREVSLAERLPDWVSAANATLTVSAATQFDGRVVLKLPAHFEADTVTFGRMLARTSLTLVSEDGDTAFRSLDASGLRSITMGIPCITADFTPAAEVTRFEKMFDNNGRAYVIAAGATLEIAESSGITTSMDVTPGFLEISPESTGILRREYTETDGRTNFPAVRFSWLHRVYGESTADTTSSGLVVLPGDRIDHPGRFALQRTSADTPWTYTQTGGEAYFTAPSPTDGGMLLFNASSASGGTANLSVSDGLLETTGIWAWRSGTKVNLTLSGTALFRLGSVGLSVNASGAYVRGTVSDDAVVEATATEVTSRNSGSVSLDFRGGTLRSALGSCVFGVPVKFTAPEDRPTKLEMPSGGRMMFGAATSAGTGALRIVSGAAVLTHASGLGAAAVTVASGAALELERVNRTFGSVVFEPGSSFVASNTTGSKTVTLGSRPPVLPADKSGMIFILNGRYYTPDQVTVAGNGLTFGTAATPETSVVWNAASKTGIWRNGLAGAWWNENRRYTDGISATFAGSRSTVSVHGRVAPSSVVMDDADGFTFAPDGDGAAGEIDLSAMGAREMRFGTDTAFDVPVITASPAKALVIKGDGNSYRQLGIRRNGTVSLFLESAALSDATQPVWLPSDVNAVTFAPHPGEVQILPPAHEAMVGSGTVTLAGGGEIRFPGVVNGTNWNGTFRGNFIVTDGARARFLMTRAQHDANGDGRPYFRDREGLALWRRITPDGEDVPGFRLRNGGSLVISGSRGLIGSVSDLDDMRMVNNHPVIIGRGASVHYSCPSDDTMRNVLPYGHRFNGDGAQLFCDTPAYFRYGTSLEVAGIGDRGDPTDPEIAPDLRLTRGIRAAVRGTVSVANPEKGDALHLNVGEDSVLDFGPASVPVDLRLEKHGSGKLELSTPDFANRVYLRVREGTLGGSARMRAFGSEVVLENGTAIGPGMNLAMLRFNGTDCTVYADMDGTRALFAETVSFDGGNAAVYRISPLAGSSIPPARGRAPLKILSWTNALGIDSTTFSLDETVRAAGYALDVAADGLYLKESQRWYRDLTKRAADMRDRQWYVLEWNKHDAWARTDLRLPAAGSDEPTPGEQLAAATPTDYAPDSAHAIEAIFVLPSAAHLPNVPSFRIKLDRETAFSSVRFVREDTLETVTQVAVSYIYVLTNAPLPGPEGTRAYTWVSYLAVEGSVPATLGEPEDVPVGYDTAVRDRTVLLYREASKPSLNISFTDGTEGTSSFISATDAPLGAVPFAGVYWTNVSTELSQIGGMKDGYTHYRTTVKVNGMGNGEGGVRNDLLSLDYITLGIASDPTRHAGAERLAATWLPGGSQRAIPADILSAARMDDPTVRSGWRLKLTAVPFRSYDLYLLMAGDSGNRRYSAVRVKVGDGSWKTYTYTDGWAAVVGSRDTSAWAGVGEGPSGSFVDGRNLLHLRVQADAVADLQIAAADARNDGSYANGDAERQGLAGLQIVSCDGAVYEKFGSNGAWSDANGWKLSANDGSYRLAAWKNPTPEEPYAAAIPISSGSVKVDRFVNVPSVRFFGDGRDFTLDGNEPMLRAVSLDFTDAGENSSVIIPRDIFLNEPTFLLPRGFTVSVPESPSGTMVNDWKWDYALGSDGNPVTNTVRLHKRFAGDLVLRSSMAHGAAIDNGTLWVETNEALTNGGTFTGAGTLGKRGTGTLTLTGPFRSSSPNPLRVSQGTLVMDTHLDQIQATAPRMTVDGGTVDLRIDQGRPAGSAPVWEVSDGGTLRVRGDCTSNRMHLRLAGRGTVSRVQAGHNQWGGYQFQSIEIEGPGNIIDNRAGGWGGPGIGALKGFRLLPNARLSVEGSVGALRITDGIINLGEGSVMVSNLAVGRGSESSYGDNSGGAGSASNSILKYPMRMIGSGRWRVKHFLGPRDSNWGISLTVEGGEISFEIPHGGYNPEVDNVPLVIRAGAILSGTSAFNDRPIVTLDSGSILRNGIPESLAGGLSLRGSRTEFAASPTGETVHNMIFDLRNSTPLKFEGAGPSVHGNGILRIRLEHPEAFRNECRLIQWPQNGAPTAWRDVENIVSSEVVALDAKFEIRNTASEAGLWLVPADAVYLSEDVSGDWSGASTWKFRGTDTAFPLYDTVPTAKIRAAAGDVTLTADATDADAAATTPWRTAALVFDAAGHRLSLVRGTDADGNPAGSPVAVSSALWKQGTGTAEISAPLIFGGRVAGVSVSADSGTLLLKEPILQMSRTGYTDLIPAVSASMTIGTDAFVRYEAPTDTLTGGLQSFSGTVGGRGTFVLAQPAAAEGMPEHRSIVEIGGAAESTADFSVERGILRLVGERETMSAPTGRRFSVAADGAQLVLGSEWGYGAGPDTVLSLLPSAAEGHSPLLATAARGVARIRGTLTLDRPEGTPEDARSANLGGDGLNLDGDWTVSVAPGNTLSVTANLGSVEDDTLKPTLTKLGGGTLDIRGTYATDADVVVEAGTLRFTGATFDQSPVSGASGSVVVKKDATLRLTEGLSVFDPTDAARFVMHSGSTLLLNVGGSEITGADVHLENGVVLKLEAAARAFPNPLLTLGERASLRRDGVVTIDLDVFDIAAIPEELDRIPIISLAADSPVFGVGTFVLGGQKQAEWAKAGWSLEVTRTSVAMVYFGGSAAYTWTGGSENGSWMAANWSSPNAKDDSGSLAPTPWPEADGDTPDTQLAVKLTDLSPIGDAFIPTARRTVFDDPAKGTRTIRALWANISGDADLAESGDFTFTSARPDQDLFINGEILKSGTSALVFRRPVRTESEAGALRLFGGTVDFGSTLVSFGRSQEYGLPVTFGGGAVLRFSGAAEQTLSGIIDAGTGSGTIERTGRGRLNLDTPVDMLNGLSATGATLALRQRNLAGLQLPITLTTADDGSEAALELASVYTEPAAVRMNVNTDGPADGVLGWQADFGGISAAQPTLARPETLAAGKFAYNVRALRYAPKAGHLILRPLPGILPDTAELRMAGGATDSTALWLGAETPGGSASLTVGALSGTGSIGVEPVTEGAAAPWRDTRVLTVALAPGSDTTYGGSVAGAVTADGHAVTAGLLLKNRDPAADTAVFRYQGISEDLHLGTLAVDSGVNAEVSGTWGGSVSLASGAMLSGSGTFGHENATFALTDGAVLSASALGSRELENGAIVREVIPTEMTVRGTLKVTQGATLRVLVRTDRTTKAPWVSCVNVDSLVVPSAIADSDAMHFRVVIDVEKGVLGASTKILGWKRRSGLRIGIRPEDITVVRAPGDTDTYDFRIEQRGDGLYLVRAKSRFWMIVR